MTKRANLAHEDEAFLSSDAGRPIRILGNTSSRWMPSIKQVSGIPSFSLARRG